MKAVFALTSQRESQKPEWISRNSGFLVGVIVATLVVNIAIIWMVNESYSPSLTICILWIAAAAVSPVYGLWHTLDRDWFHPLLYPLIYIEVVLFAPTLYVLIKHENLSVWVSMSNITSRLLEALGLTGVGIGLGMAITLILTDGKKQSNKHNSVTATDFYFIRRCGRWLLFLAVVLQVESWRRLAGTAYGASQTTYGTTSTLATIGPGLLFVSIILIVVGNVKLRNRWILGVQDILLFAVEAVLTLSRGGRADILAPLLFILWAHHTYVKRLSVSILVVLTVFVLALFTTVGYVREPAGTARPSVIQSSLVDIASPTFITANVVSDVPEGHSYYMGTTYVAAVERQLPGFIANRLLGSPATATMPTGSYAYRDLIGFTNPNQGYGFAFPAESYINFGMTGVFVAAAGLGWLLAWSYRRCRSDPNRALDLLYPVLIANLPDAFRTDALGDLKMILYPMIILAVVFHIARKTTSVERVATSTTV